MTQRSHSRRGFGLLLAASLLGPGGAPRPEVAGRAAEVAGRAAEVERLADVTGVARLTGATEVVTLAAATEAASLAGATNAARLADATEPERLAGATEAARPAGEDGHREPAGPAGSHESSTPPTPSDQTPTLESGTGLRPLDGSDPRSEERLVSAFLGASTSPSRASSQQKPTPGSRKKGRPPARPSARSRPAAPLPPPASVEEGLRRRLARPPFAGARAGAVVVSLKDGRTIFESRGDLPLMPASTMKVLTGAAILDRLGPDWRFQTRFLTRALPIDGVIAGDLYVKGSCQPDIVVERFAEIAAGLREAGVREIHGDLVADLLYFDGEERPPDWPRGGAPNPYAAPISALAANFSSIRITVQPASRAGAKASVVVDPPSAVVPVVANVLTVSKGPTSIHAVRKLETAGDRVVINRIVVTGKIRRTAPPWQRFIPVEAPATVAAYAIKRALQDAGILIRGDVRRGEAPAGAVPVYTLHSKPLDEIVWDMNKHSNNFIAEMLLRALGAESYGAPASRDKGAQAITSFLRTSGVDSDTVRLTDGSGLSRSNLLTARVLARVLVRMWADPAIGAPFVASLPISGLDGTLQGRLGGATGGRILAKTGRLSGVASLAGYVEGTSEGPVAFAFLVNGVESTQAARGIDDLCRILCTAGPQRPTNPQ